MGSARGMRWLTRPDILFSKGAKHKAEKRADEHGRNASHSVLVVE